MENSACSRPRKARGAGQAAHHCAIRAAAQIAWHRSAGLIGKAQAPAHRASRIPSDLPLGCPSRSVAGARFRYGFGETRVGLLGLLTFIVPSGRRSGGVVMAKFSGHDVIFRSSPTVFADTPMSGSTSTCIRSGQLPRSVWSEAILFTLYRMRAPSSGLTGREPPTTFRCRR